MASALDKFRSLVEAQAKARNTVEKNARKAVRARTTRMKDDDWRDYDAVTAFAADTKRIVNTYQRQQAALVNAYHARQLTMVSDRTAAPVEQINVENLRGVPDTSTYGRLADHFRFLRDNDARLHTAAEAYELVAARAEAVADIDMLLAHREQEHRFLRSKRIVTGWRYVVHPELSPSGTCGLCLAASDRVYNRTRRRAIHAYCKCEAVEITGEPGQDFGFQLNQDDLGVIYAKAGGTKAGDALRRTRFTIREHGELGPVLTYRGQQFRGPKQVREDTTHDKPLPDS